MELERLDVILRGRYALEAAPIYDGIVDIYLSKECDYVLEHSDFYLLLARTMDCMQLM